MANTAKQTQTSAGQSSSFTPTQWGILAGAAALSLFGLTRRSKTGVAVAAAGGLLAYKGATAGTAARKHPAEASFAINCSPETAYNFWRNLENLPRFMRHLQSVRATGDNRSEWTADGPMGKPVHWTAETTEDVANQRIAWRSLPGSDVDTTGSVEFRPGPAGRGTIVRAVVRYRSPGGSLGRGVAALAGKHPEFTVREDLRRFKAILETGEVPTTRGQSHGPRGVTARGERALLREPQNSAEPQAGRAPSQTPREIRRTA
jgi:uncharacterized membrane protein